MRHFLWSPYYFVLLGAFVSVAAIAPGGLQEPLVDAQNSLSQGVAVSYSPDCYDKAQDCASRKKLCENRVFWDEMTKECAKTCGRCGTPPPPAAYCPPPPPCPPPPKCPDPPFPPPCPPPPVPPPCPTTPPTPPPTCPTPPPPPPCPTLPPPPPPCPTPAPPPPPECRDLAPNCTENKGLCQNPTYRETMRKNCAWTCGYCPGGPPPPPPPPPPVPECRDLASNCAANKALCQNEIYRELMKKDCAWTCGYCPGGPPPPPPPPPPAPECRDLASNCTENQNLCQNEVYRELMKKECARTCGYCTG